MAKYAFIGPEKKCFYCETMYPARDEFKHDCPQCGESNESAESILHQIRTRRARQDGLERYYNADNILNQIRARRA